MMTQTRSGYQLEHLSFAYDGVTILHDLSIDFQPGFFYGMIGPNGSGKSTLLDLLTGFLQGYTGRLRLDDLDLHGYAHHDLAKLVSSVPQSFSLNFDFTVEEVVMMGRHPFIGRFSKPHPRDFEIVEEALERLSVGAFRNRPVRQLSGGEQQRVMIARALAQQTPYLLLDEVTAHLDINHSVTIMQVMKDLVKGGATVIAALHDLNMALAFCDRIIVIQEGKIIRNGEAEQVLTGETIMQLYRLQAHLLTGKDGTRHIQLVYR